MIAEPALDRRPQTILERRTLLRTRILQACLHPPSALRLLGTHDFSSFGANARDGRREKLVKDLRRLEIGRHGPRVELVTEASGYLYRMVRSLAGCLVEVGTGRLSPDDVSRILEARTRTSLVATAPPQGLCLREVFYD